MRKPGWIVLFFLSFLFLVSCANTADNKNVTPSPSLAEKPAVEAPPVFVAEADTAKDISADKTDPAEGTKPEGTPAGGLKVGRGVTISEVSRKEAGLSVIAPVDFSKFSVNQRIKELLAEPRQYKNQDYRDGIAEEGGLLINERFKGNIIQDITLGTGIDHVKSVLGQPNVVKDDFIFYKTKEFYLGFKGTEKVEYAYFRKSPRKYNRDILKLVIEQISLKDSDLQGAVSDSAELGSFFDSGGHIHGGGWYENSSCGVAVWQFDESSITVFNNFEGTLYEAKDFNYAIQYENTDYVVDTSIQFVNSYLSRNDEFDREGVLSPSGRLKSTFLWGNSMVYYFTIKTLDNSRPDFTVHAPAGEYWWLTDEYILYMNAWTSAPYVERVSDMVSDEASINVMYAVGIFEKDDMFQDHTVNFAVKDIKNNVISFYDEENQKEYRVEYSFNNDKKILFKLLK